MNPELLRVSVLYGAGTEDPELPEILQNIPNLRFLKQALDPETFLTLHEKVTPDLVLVDLNGLSHVPDWLEQMISRLPRSEIVVCSQSRDPDFLIRIMKLRVGAFVPLPINPRELEDTVERIRTELAKQRADEPYPSQFVAVTGTKGGVGTTALSTNLAVALAELMPGRILLVDLARPFPHAGQFLDLKATHTIMDLVHSADTLDSVFIQKTIQRHKSKLDVLLSNPEYSLESTCFTDTGSLAKIITTLRTSYSWVVVDLGAWLDSMYTTLLQEADQILLVTELTVPDLHNLKKLKALYRNWSLEDAKVKVVVNRYEKDYTLGLRDLENIFLRPAIATLPSDYASLIEAINQGVPLNEVAPRSKLWRSIKSLAAELIAQSQRKTDEQAKKGLLQRLFLKKG